MDHPRPDPARGVIETILVRDGECVELAHHLARMTASCAALGLPLPAGLERRVVAAAEDGRLRITVDGGGARIETGPLPRPGPVSLTPATLAGGLGAHKWADRRWIDSIGSPLICDTDGEVLEAGHAAVLIVERGVLIAPPLDERRLPSVSRAQLLARTPARIERIDLDRVRGADALILTSALRGPHAGVLPGGPPTAASEAAAAGLG
jgi:para-aminobenzoate synthetase/4-amino-4-deoxychorismate lyase